MSSITGYWISNAKEKSIPGLTDRMLKAAPHRGPEFNRYTCENGVELGIGSGTNPAESGLEAYDDSAGVRVVMDGMIFSCSDTGDEGASKSDAGLVLKTYLQHQEDFLSKIDGSFSLALYDGKKRKLIIARDRLGTKPLFYFTNGNSLFFGSEMKMVLESGQVEKRVSLDAINWLLSYSYVPGPYTMLEGIQQVRPGHFLVLDNGNLSERAYWRFQYQARRRSESEEVLAEEFLEIFETAIRRRYDRFPDAGAFLSGGLDTSSVAAIMRKIKGSSFKVFTAGFKEEAFNEIEDARIVADHLDVDFITTIVNYEDGFSDLLEKLVWHHDSPFADTSAIPSYYAAKLAKEHTDTVLTGDFPDQLIGGSGHQVRALSREKNDGILLKTLRGLHLNALMHRMPWKSGGTSLPDKAKRFLYRESHSLEEQRILEGMPVPPLLKRCLYSRDLLDQNIHNNPLDLASNLYSEVGGEHLLDKLLYFDVLSYAPDDLMIKVERMTAAHGLNTYSPFHDRDLVHFVSSLPPNMKIRGNERKFIMRRAMGRFLPEHTMNKKKQGFAMPIGEWLVKNLADYVRDILLDSRTLNRGYFDRAFMRTLIENFLSGKSDYASGNETTMICLLTLELWHRIFMDHAQ